MFEFAVVTDNCRLAKALRIARRDAERFDAAAAKQIAKLKADVREIR